MFYAGSYGIFEHAGLAVLAGIAVLVLLARVLMR
jgi:hypothetical protein